MRFTVKAKLASAFGLIIVLSAVAGGVAYTRLGDMIVTAESLVARAGRMEKATELEKGILQQVRAEQDSLLASGADAVMGGGGYVAAPGGLAARLARVPVVIHQPHGHIFYGYWGRPRTRLFVTLERAAAR